MSVARIERIVGVASSGASNGAQTVTMPAIISDRTWIQCRFRAWMMSPISFDPILAAAFG